MDIINLPRLECYCHHHCPPQFHDEGKCSVEWGGRCFAAVEEVYNSKTGFLEPEFSYGCFNPGDQAFLQCKGHLVEHEIPASILCCESNYCNENLKPTYTPTNITNGLHPYFHPTTHDYFLIQILLGAVLSLFILSLLIVLYIIFKYRSRRRSSKPLIGEEGNKLVNSDFGDSSNIIKGSEMHLLDISVGSGSGGPHLVQRTVGRQICLKSRIGKGRYGDVFLGEWRGTRVAVKSFQSTENELWEREKEIYQLALMKHPNILVGLGWDICSVENETRMIRITDYHPHGSLYDYLETRSLSEEELLRLLLSSASALCHLHMEIEGKPPKPGIAHRNLTTRNVLINRVGEAVVGDFSLSVTSGGLGKGGERAGLRTGCKRYQAPEVLDGTLKSDSFESYKSADIYSYALILWEMGSRTKSRSQTSDFKDECEPYEIPYFSQCSSSDPTTEIMRQIVCESKIRPLISTRWASSMILSVLAKIISECWHGQPKVRLSALRIKKSFTELRRINEGSSPQTPQFLSEVY